MLMALAVEGRPTTLIEFLAEGAEGVLVEVGREPPTGLLPPWMAMSLETLSTLSEMRSWRLAPVISICRRVFAFADRSGHRPGRNQSDARIEKLKE